MEMERNFSGQRSSKIQAVVARDLSASYESLPQKRNKGHENNSLDLCGAFEETRGRLFTASRFTTFWFIFQEPQNIMFWDNVSTEPTKRHFFFHQKKKKDFAFSILS